MLSSHPLLLILIRRHFIKYLFGIPAPDKMDRNLILLQIGICVGRGNKPITIAIRRAVAAVEDHKFQSMSPINERVRGVLFCRILAQAKREWWVTGDNNRARANYPRDYRMFSLGNFSGNWFTICNRPYHHPRQDYNIGGSSSGLMCGWVVDPNGVAFVSAN